MWKTVALVIVALAVLAGGIAYYLSHRALPPSPDTGVPIYPGATQGDSFAARLKPSDRARLVKAVLLHTDDPLEKVIEYYKEALKGSHLQVLERKAHSAPGAVMTADINGEQKLIMITSNEDTGKTDILIGNVEQLRNTDIPLPKR